MSFVIVEILLYSCHGLSNCGLVSYHFVVILDDGTQRAEEMNTKVPESSPLDISLLANFTSDNCSSDTASENVSNATEDAIITNRFCRFANCVAWCKVADNAHTAVVKAST